MTSPFIYLLNAMEGAAKAESPFEHGYGDKRRAVLDYVAKLESASKSETSTPADDVLETLCRVRDSLKGTAAWAGAQKCVMAIRVKNAAPQAQAEGVALHGGSSPQPAVAATASPYDVSGNPAKEYPGE